MARADGVSHIFSSYSTPWHYHTQTFAVPSTRKQARFPQTPSNLPESSTGNELDQGQTLFLLPVQPTTHSATFKALSLRVNAEEDV